MQHCWSNIIHATLLDATCWSCLNTMLDNVGRGWLQFKLAYNFRLTSCNIVGPTSSMQHCWMQHHPCNIVGPTSSMQHCWPNNVVQCWLLLINRSLFVSLPRSQWYFYTWFPLKLDIETSTPFGYRKTLCCFIRLKNEEKTEKC